MRHIVYKVTNTINNKYYIGYHKTRDVNDKYLGSGTIIKKAVAKYGISKFVKEILFETSDQTKALEKEDELISLSLLDPLCMNIRRGGAAGWNGEQHPERRERLRQLNKGVKNPQFGTKWIVRYGHEKKIKAKELETWLELGFVEGRSIKGQPNLKNRGRKGTLGLKHSLATKLKISESAKKRRGNKNPSFGRICIYNPLNNMRKRIISTEIKEWINRGWVEGFGRFNHGNKISSRKIGTRKMINQNTGLVKMISSNDLEKHLVDGWEFVRKTRKL
jgi:hypothetical protein